MIKPNSRQCEIARFITGSNVKDEIIIKELNATSKEEWNKMFSDIDNLMKKHNMPLTSLNNKNVMTCAREWVSISDDFISISAPEGIDEATLFLAYMNLQTEC